MGRPRNNALYDRGCPLNTMSFIVDKVLKPASLVHYYSKIQQTQLKQFSVVHVYLVTVVLYNELHVLLYKLYMYMYYNMFELFK